VATIAN
jgi:acetyl-CoA acyltransferase 1